MISIASLKRMVLHKLIRSNIWGAKHTPLYYVLKSIPEHFRNNHNGKKIIEKVLKDLLNDELVIILFKKTGKGSDQHISLNPRKVSEIKQFLDEF